MKTQILSPNIAANTTRPGRERGEPNRRDAWLCTTNTYMPLVASESVLRPVSVVLLHGFLGDRRDLEPLRRALAPSFGCITYDLPGHGDTAHLADKAEKSSEGNAILHGLVAALEGLRQPSGVALVGYSLGARLALQVAVLRPDLVTAVVALGGSPGLVDEASREARLARDRDLASKLREMEPAAFALWLREEWYARASRAA